MAGVAGSAAKGALGGAGAGLSIGANPLLMGATGGLSAPIGAAVGAVAGGVSSGIKANKAKKADEAIQAQDPQELARLAEINRIRKSIGAGTDPLTQQAINQAQQTGASTQANVARVTGGNVGATVAAMTRAQRGTQAATNQAVAGAQQRLPFFENMGQQLSTRISQRALEVGLMRRDQAMAEKAAAGKAASANISGAIGMLGNMAPGGAGAGMGGAKAGALPVDQGGSFANGQVAPKFTPSAGGLIDDPSLNPLNESFVNDGDSPMKIEQLAPQVQGVPLSNQSAMTRIGKQFDPNTVFPNGVPQLNQQSPAPATDHVNKAAPLINALGTATQNLGSFGNVPL